MAGHQTTYRQAGGPVKGFLVLLCLIQGFAKECKEAEKKYKDECILEHDQGPCSPREWITEGKCEVEPCVVRCYCIDGFVRRKKDNKCHRLSTQAFCKEKEVLQIYENKMACLPTPCREPQQMPWTDVGDSDDLRDVTYEDGRTLDAFELRFEASDYFRDYKCLDISSGTDISNCQAVVTKNETITCWSVEGQSGGLGGHKNDCRRGWGWSPKWSKILKEALEESHEDILDNTLPFSGEMEIPTQLVRWHLMSLLVNSS